MVFGLRKKMNPITPVILVTKMLAATTGVHPHPFEIQRNQHACQHCGTEVEEQRATDDHR